VFLIPELALSEAEGLAPKERAPTWGTKLNPRQRQLFADESSRAFWQAHFYDFNVWTTKKRIEKLRYMRGNPVKRGLVDTPEQWRWSSYDSIGSMNLEL
jgi:REP element-mobilizing transposase RayT